MTCMADFLNLVMEAQNSSQGREELSPGAERQIAGHTIVPSLPPPHAEPRGRT